MNELAGCSSVPAADTHFGTSTFDARDRVAQSYRSFGAPHDPSLLPEGALTQLLGSTAYYSDARVDILPYAKEQVSWPAEGGTNSVGRWALGGR